MIHFFQIEMSPFFDYFISHTDIGFHRSIWILLLHKIDAYHSFPLIRAGLIEYFKVHFLTPELQSKEDESGAEVRMFFPDFKIDLIKCRHIHLFIMLFNKITTLIKLFQLTKKCSKLYSIVAVFDKFKKDVAGILLKDMQGEYQDKEVRDLLLEENPKLMLIARYYLELVFG
jgi:hypothetical protein